MSDKNNSLAQIGVNPLQIFQDPRVIATGGGVFGANMTRIALYKNQRGTFGYARNVGGVVKYFTQATGGVEIPSAKTNRMLLNAGGVLAGTLLMSLGKEAKKDDVLSSTDDTTLIVKYAGLGFAASSFVNLFAAIFDIDL